MCVSTHLFKLATVASVLCCAMAHADWVGVVHHSGNPTVVGEGQIDLEKVLTVLKSRENHLRACYERELMRQPELQGKVVLLWKIRLDGTVATTQTQLSTLKNAAVEGCIQRGLRAWTFPRPEGTVVSVRHGLLFTRMERPGYHHDAYRERVTHWTEPQGWVSKKVTPVRRCYRVEGFIDVAQLEALTQPRLASIRACVTKAAEAQPRSDAGALAAVLEYFPGIKFPSLTPLCRVEWTVGSDGKARDLRFVESRAKNAGAEKCIDEQLRGLAWPAPDGGTARVGCVFY